MASVEKYSLQAVHQILQHVCRENATYSNTDIDPGRAHLNYSLTPERNMHPYDYYKKRMNEIHHQKRKDLKPVFGWVVSLPDDVPPEREEEFFLCVARFLLERYGEDNCLSICIHYDEGGKPHLHYLGIAAVESEKHGLKISAKERLTRAELRNFHPDMQRALRNAGVPGSVNSGITAKQGGNRSVRELKKERPLDRILARQHEYERGR